MVQIAGRLCEYYASDIIFESVNFRNAANDNQPYHKYIFFRENGVESFAPYEVDYIQGTDYIQAWELRFIPTLCDGTQIFQRIYINESI
jgi:hypothetical protein